MSSVQFDGLLNFYKPTGTTSAKALYRIRKITGVRKSGHAGTLDPAAEGVLLICMGQATKRVESLMNLPKVYRAVGRLDVTSRSLDADSPLEAVRIETIPTLEQIRQAIQKMVGVIDQVPPVVSALKVGGVPAYRLTRQNRPPLLQPRKVRIDRLTIEKYAWPMVEFEVTCGRGTYVRAIIRDLGEQLQTAGCLTNLIRTAIGPFTAQNAVHFENLDQTNFKELSLSLPQLSETITNYLDSNDSKSVATLD